MYQPTPFQRQLNQYMRIMGYQNLVLTEAEIDHLNKYQGNRLATPEATDAQIKDSLDIEVKRGLARRYGFELLNRAGTLKARLSESLTDDEKAQMLANLAELHHEFIEDQHNAPLSYDNFIILAKHAYEHDIHLKEAIRISCFLTINDSLKRTVGPLMGDVKDSEIFLSQLASLICEGAVELPLTEQASPETKQHLKTLFYPGMHFRHMLFTEGGVAMFKTFREGVASKTFTQDMLNAWSWRWVTNLFGFQLGKGAKMYTDSMHSIVTNLQFDLDELFKNADTDILHSYLAGRAMLAGLDLAHGKIVDENLKKFYGHLAAMFHVITIDSVSGLGEAIVAGYEAFKENAPDADELKDLYLKRISNSEMITPTYVPAILNNAYEVFLSQGETKDNAVKLAVEFACHTFLALEQALDQNPQQLISCMELAQKNNIESLTTAWKDNKNAFRFQVIQEHGEFKLRAMERVVALRVTK